MNFNNDVAMASMNCFVKNTAYNIDYVSIWGIRNGATLDREILIASEHAWDRNGDWSDSNPSTYYEDQSPGAIQEFRGIRKIFYPTSSPSKVQLRAQTSDTYSWTTGKARFCARDAANPNWDLQVPGSGPGCRRKLAPRRVLIRASKVGEALGEVMFDVIKGGTIELVDAVTTDQGFSHNIGSLIDLGGAARLAYVGWTSTPPGLILSVAMDVTVDCGLLTYQIHNAISDSITPLVETQLGLNVHGTPVADRFSGVEGSSTVATAMRNMCGFTTVMKYYDAAEDLISAGGKVLKKIREV
jgi:hypothetical protein